MGLTAGLVQPSIFAPHLLSCPLTLLLPQIQEPQSKATVYFRERFCIQTSYVLASGASESPDQHLKNTCFRNNPSVKTSTICQRPLLKMRSGVAALACDPRTLSVRPARLTQWPRSSRGMAFQCGGVARLLIWILALWGHWACASSGAYTFPEALTKS